jgi:hypothetical protein
VPQIKLFRLNGSGSGRAAQESLGADVFVNFWPVDTVAASGNLPITALIGGGVEQPWVPRERDGDGTTVLQPNAQRVLIKRYVRHSLICRYCQNIDFQSSKLLTNHLTMVSPSRATLPFPPTGITAVLVKLPEYVPSLRDSGFITTPPSAKALGYHFSSRKAGLVWSSSGKQSPHPSQKKARMGYPHPSVVTFVLRNAFSPRPIHPRNIK